MLMTDSVSAHRRKGREQGREGNGEQGRWSRPVPTSPASKIAAPAVETVDNRRAHRDAAILWPDPPGKRHPRKRRGEREPLSPIVRMAVIIRDGNRCKECGDRPLNTEVDHVIPWSANGPDDTTNLRVLCRRCNQDRSNYVDPIAESRVYLPATFWCTDCWSTPEAHERQHYEAGTQCWLFQKLGTTEYAAQWQAEPLLDPDLPRVLAFCAHCDATGYTTRPL